jgi:hypothetical protein
MLAKSTLAGSLMLSALTLVPAAAPAAPAHQSLMPGAIAAEGKLLQQVQWGRCHAWRHECAARWGWRTPMYYRCLGRHGC